MNRFKEQLDCWLYHGYDGIAVVVEEALNMVWAGVRIALCFLLIPFALLHILAERFDNE